MSFLTLDAAGKPLVCTVIIDASPAGGRTSYANKIEPVAIRQMALEVLERCVHKERAGGFITSGIDHTIGTWFGHNGERRCRRLPFFHPLFHSRSPISPFIQGHPTCCLALNLYIRPRRYNPRAFPNHHLPSAPIQLDGKPRPPIDCHRSP